jgi:DNA-binding PadR family transcriptional regulator
MYRVDASSTDDASQTGAPDGTGRSTWHDATRRCRSPSSACSTSSRCTATSKRLDVVIGALRRRISFGSLYPTLRDLQGLGLIEQIPDEEAPALASRRTRVVYAITGAGRARLADLLSTSGPPSWEDDQFDVHFAFFGRTTPEVRLRILEGRRTRMQERLERARLTAERPLARLDGYLAELQRHSRESVERELSWLDGLIERERTSPPPATSTGPGGPAGSGSSTTST